MKTALIICAILLFLFLMPLCVRVTYSDRLTVRAGVFLPIFRVLPRKEKKPKKKSAAHKEEKNVQNKKKKFKMPDVGMIWGLIRRFPRYVRRLVTVRRLHLDVTVGNADPGDLAMTYGAANAALESIYVVLAPVFPVDRWKINITPDFDLEKTEISGNALALTNLLRILSVLISAGFYVILNSNKEKGDNNDG